MSAAPTQKYELSTSFTFDQVKPFLSERCIKGMEKIKHDQRMDQFFKEEGVLVKAIFHKLDETHIVTFHSQYNDSLELIGIFIRVIYNRSIECDSEMIVWNSQLGKLLTMNDEEVRVDQFSLEKRTPREISKFLSDLIDDRFAIIAEESERPKFSFSSELSSDFDSLKKISDFFGDFREVIPNNIRDQIPQYVRS
ncbi:MAG: hypothetical protein IT584_02950 [Chlamydiae bacterium]|nr:hypothetical protein [Chlamydiota bacterium]